MTRPGSRRLGQVLRRVALVLALANVGCGGSVPRSAPVAPLYTPEDAALFNDLFRPELFGYPAIAPPESDTLLPDRVARATSVVPARVVTVTREGDGETRESYGVVVRPIGAPLAGTPLPGPVTLTVAANSPIFGWLEGGARPFVGTELLLFVHVYRDGPHFHGTLNVPAVRDAVVRARLAALPPKN
jgi:hypothetical protein